MDHAPVDALAEAFRDGRDAALQPLVETLARPLLAQAYRYLGDWDLAADLVQETWLRVVQSIGGYDPELPFRPWVRTILRNLCWQHLARSARSPRTLPLAEAAASASTHPTDDPELVAREKDLRGRVHRHLAAMPATQRLAVLLVDLEQHDHREVAGRLSLTPASLRVVLCRARRTLAERLLAEETS